MSKLIIGSHVKMSGPKYLVGSVNEAINYEANAMMFYTGAPQNTIRTDINKMKVSEMWDIWKQNNLEQMIVHAPYIINLANTIDESKATFGVEFLVKEIKRVDEIGAKIVVLHPGSHLKQGMTIGLDKVIDNLNKVFEQTSNSDVVIAIETMSGKGSEVCIEFSQIKYIIDNCKFPNRLGICLDTCHIWDAGYDIVNNWDGVVEEFNKNALMPYLKVIHLNDSKNVLNSHKDRHENIGFGHIGFDALKNIAYDPRFEHVAKILETPYIDKKFAPYKEEILMLKNKSFDANVFKKFEN